MTTTSRPFATLTDARLCLEYSLAKDGIGGKAKSAEQRTLLEREAAVRGLALR